MIVPRLNLSTNEITIPDTCCENFPSEGLSKAQSAAITASLYNPNYTQNAIFANVAKLVIRSFYEMSSNPLHWCAKIDTSLHKIYLKLIWFFFNVQIWGQPRYCLIEILFRKINIDILGFADGDLNFSLGAVYLVLHSNKDPVP